jgi:hypothetical protein
MIYDCFPFFNELDLLEIRLTELDPVVDRFVIVESPLTHSGQPKPLYFLENQARFKRWEKKIIHVQVLDPNPDVIAWDRENQQRNTILHGIQDAKDDDLIMVSDVDEIISAKSIEESMEYCLQQMEFKRVAHFEQRGYYYYFNLRHRLNWHSACVGTAKVIRELTPQIARYSDLKRDEIIPDGGWHFTYMGGVKKVIEKMKAFAHWNEPVNMELIRKFESGEDPLEVDFFKLRQVTVWKWHPKAIWNNEDRWKALGYIQVFP